MTWLNDARCRDLDPDLFFGTHTSTERRAKAVCGRCSVREPCLAYALASRVEFGVFGGLSGRERRAMLAARARPGRGLVVTV